MHFVLQKQTTKSSDQARRKKYSNSNPCPANPNENQRFLPFGHQDQMGGLIKCDLMM